MDKLLTTQELTDTAPDSSGIDQAKFEQIIFQTEKNFFALEDNGLGKDYYSELKADINPNTGFIPFNPNIVYNLGDIVLFNGVYYDCIQTTTAPSYQNPTNAAFFKPADKFLTAANNTLYDEYIKTAISYLTMFNATPMIAQTITASGVSKAEKSGFTAASPAEKNEKRGIYINFANLTIANMKTFILDNQALYPTTLLVKKATQSKCADKDNQQEGKKNGTLFFGGFSF